MTVRCIETRPKEIVWGRQLTWGDKSTQAVVIPSRTELVAYAASNRGEILAAEIDRTRTLRPWRWFCRWTGNLVPSTWMGFFKP
jgi:hypothetical protein